MSLREVFLLITFLDSIRKTGVFRTCLTEPHCMVLISLQKCTYFNSLWRNWKLLGGTGHQCFFKGWYLRINDFKKRIEESRKTLRMHKHFNLDTGVIWLCGFDTWIKSGIIRNVRHIEQGKKKKWLCLFKLLSLPLKFVLLSIIAIYYSMLLLMCSWFSPRVWSLGGVWALWDMEIFLIVSKCFYYFLKILARLLL